MDVFDASKVEDRKAGTLTNVESASEWLIAYCEEIGGGPQKIRDLESAAQVAGRWFSKGTFERARARLRRADASDGSEGDTRRGVRLATE